MILPQPTVEFLRGLERLGVALPPANLDALGHFLALLLEANRSMNLTGVDEPDAAWERHILDCLTLLPHLGRPDLAADIGSGGGLPGIPLAIVRPGIAFTLIEATGKKADFLRRAVGILRLSNVVIRAERAESLGRHPEQREKYDLVTGRAVGPLNVFLELAAPLTRVGGRILAMKGRNVADEVTAAAHAIATLNLEIAAVHQVDKIPGYGATVELTKRKSTDAKYPRRPGMPSKRPL